MFLCTRQSKPSREARIGTLFIVPDSVVFVPAVLPDLLLDLPSLLPPGPPDVVPVVDNGNIQFLPPSSPRMCSDCICKCVIVLLGVLI